MVLENKHFIAPENENQKLWRYVDFTKFLELINSKSLFFSPINNLNDPFEGSITLKTKEWRKKWFKFYQKLGKIESEESEEWWNKRNAFEHEKEFRCLIWHLSGENYERFKDSTTGIRVKVDPQDLIENIYISHSSPSWIKPLIENICERYELNIPIHQSQLVLNPTF